MKKQWLNLAAVLSVAALTASAAFAQEVNGKGGNGGNGQVQDITKELLIGPGSINVGAIKDIHMSFGGLIRIIPTMENNYDFGMKDKAASKFLPMLPAANQLDKAYFKNHANEAGGLNNSYIRSEDRVYFNAMPGDRAWSFYAALEFDRALDTNVVDERGGRTGGSNFGLERLHGTMALPYDMRLHAGWDIWGLDYGEAAGMVYGDDNPGFWLTGGQGPLSFNAGYFKLGENNFQNSITDLKSANSSNNRDRDLFAGYVDYKINDGNKAKFFYAYDQIRNVPTKTLIGVLTGGAIPGTNFSAVSPSPKTDSHHVGGYYVGNFGPVELFGEGVYQFGSSEGTGLGTTAAGVNQNDMDISAYALSADVALEMKDLVGFSVKPHVGFMYTSGDDNAGDDKLNGYQGVNNAQRFSQRWGGENTILGDTNLVLGSLLYGYLPELYGNGTPVATGGLQNTIGLGGGRGDTPGMTMVSYGVTVTPKKHIIFKTNANSIWWNEDFKVNSFMTGAASTVKSGYVGSEWDNELTLALSKNTFIKGQVSYFFPGDVIKDVTTALGAAADQTASRYAMELIWNF